MEWIHGDYYISDDVRRLDIDGIGALLAGSYWAADRSREVIDQSVAGSLCLGLYFGERQIGFARWITDRATFAYLCDVIIAPEFRGQGLGKWLVECAISHPAVAHLSQMLATRDAHGLYERYGFARSETMRRKPIAAVKREESRGTENESRF